MTLKKKIIIAVIVIAVVSVSVIGIKSFVSSVQTVFNGDRVRNPDEYFLNFTYMNQEDSHSMNLDENDSFVVTFDIQKGRVDLTIGIEGEEPVYVGNNISSGDFEVGITKSGLYTVKVKAEKAVGKIAIKVKENEAFDAENLCGPWHLNSEKNDLKAFEDSFPGYAEFGASMEVKSNGLMSWYIGAEGWHGEYEVKENTMQANLVSELSEQEKTWNFDIEKEEDSYILEMIYDNRIIYWIYGDQENKAAGD